jgi:hypothetical protein
VQPSTKIVSRLNSSAKVSSAARVDRFAQAYKIQAGMHNHASMAPNEFSTSADFKKAMEGRSRYLCMNLDIGHFTAAGFDPVSFLEENHHRITTLHVKDRKRNRDGEQGENVPLGQGDTPVKEVLRSDEEEEVSDPRYDRIRVPRCGYDRGSASLPGLHQGRTCLTRRCFSHQVLLRRVSSTMNKILK